MQADSPAKHLGDLEAFAVKELSQAQADLGELLLLIRQTTGEVERLTQRSSQAKAKQREAEANLEGYSRQDLRQIFTSSADSQLRLLMMQSQSEQLQSRRRSLESHIELLQRTIDTISSVGASAGAKGTSFLSLYSSETATTAGDSAPARLAASRVLQMQEDERSRIAREIHDGPVQALTNVLLRAEICERLMGRDPTTAREELKHLKDLVASNLRDTRRFVFDVRPMTLDDLGLLPTLRKYVDALREKCGFTVEIMASGQERRLDPHLEVALFRIAQEALQNVAQHAEAHKARIVLDLDGERANVCVEDDGQGFDVDAALAMARERGITTYGLAGMFGRAEMLGGKLLIESSPGHGTRLTAAIPTGN
ncbi:MAG: sensor histidine kinase [Chloroflexi bacterium]|nr:sensor histidine kinase [Chloroflexota bacterium]